MSRRSPADQFYYADWLRDVELQMASSSTRGIWMNALAHMWFAETRGELRGQVSRLAQFLNATLEEFDLFLAEAEALHFCYVSRNSNFEVTLRNRRMFRNEKERNNNRLRQQRFREKRSSNDKITPSSSSSSSSSKKTPIIPFKKIIEYLNQKTGKNFSSKSKMTQRLIRARWNEGHRFEDFKAVIDNKCDKWLTDAKMLDYLRPQTLFGTKFEAYLNENKPEPEKQKLEEQKVMCSKCNIKEMIAYYDDGEPYCEDCWPVRRKPDESKMPGKHMSESDSMTQAEREDRVRLLRDQAKSIKKKKILGII